eukprot:4253611-Amphidinium_carterae.2
MSTLRVRGVAIENPWKAKKKLEARTVYVPPDTLDKVSVYVDYLQAKGIASEGAMRAVQLTAFECHSANVGGRRSGCGEHRLEPSGRTVDSQRIHHGFGWQRASCVRYRKILEVGPKGAPRRASFVRKADPARFKHDKWNGSSECLTISLTEYYVQYWYKNKHGHFLDVKDPGALEAMKLGDIGLITRPDERECMAGDRYCIPCGGKFGQIFPCMLCENWAHMGCSYGVEGGRVCASHVAVLDAGEGIAMIISDPTDRLVGTILRPTRLYGNASSGKRQRPSKANRGENNTTEHARRWEQIAMCKSIWLAAGMQYELRNEETGVELQPCERGMVERLTPVDGQACQRPGTSERRMSRALILESTKAYMDQK